MLINEIKRFHWSRAMIYIRGQTHGIMPQLRKPVAFPYLYRSCARDICKISTFQFKFPNVWVDTK